MSDAATHVEVPPSLDLLDVVGNGMDCERFLWIRALSDPDLPRKSRIDLLDDVQRHPGELLHVAASDGSSAATLATVADTTGEGATYLELHAREDPGEPTLGAYVELACGRARAAGAPQVRFGDTVGHPTVAALAERHGFREQERWRRFHFDVADAAAAALPEGLRLESLAARPELAEATFAAYREGIDDTPGDFPRPEETLDGWLAEHDSSPILGRELVIVLVDEHDQVQGMVELERMAAASDRAWLEFLTVARPYRGSGLGVLLKRGAAAHAAAAGLRRLQSIVHETNRASLRLNEQAGWIEGRPRAQLRLDVST